MVCEDIFDFLFEEMDKKLMEQRVNKQFKAHSVKTAIVTSLNTIYIQSIMNDPGDDPKNQMNSTMISGFEPYNYDEECTEPEPAKVDNNGGNRLANRPEAYNCRLRVTQFNRLYKQGERSSEPNSAS